MASGLAHARSLCPWGLSKQPHQQSIPLPRPGGRDPGSCGSSSVLCLRSQAASLQVYRCGHRRHCYPTSWQRWAFYLLPGISMAALGIAIYTSMMTSDNYYYTHSLWHVLLAGSAACLLPPREEHTKPWACSQKLTCHYQICKNHREDLYTVT